MKCEKCYGKGERRVVYLSGNVERVSCEVCSGTGKKLILNERDKITQAEIDYNNMQHVKLKNLFIFKN